MTEKKNIDLQIDITLNRIEEIHLFTYINQDKKKGIKYYD